MSIAGMAEQLARASAAHEAAPTARRGVLAVIQQQRSSTMMHGETHRERVYVPCKVASVDRSGVVKAVVLVDGRRVERRDWVAIEVDSRGMVADVDAVLRQLVETEGGRRPIEYHDQAEAVAAIKRAAGIEPEQEPGTVPKIPQKRDSAPSEGKAARGHLRVVENSPIRENETVERRKTPQRRTNTEARDREHLTEREIELLYQAAKGYGRNGARDALMIWMAYRHGLRVGELVSLRWAAHIDFDTSSIRVERLKNGVASVHPLGERELRGLRRLQKAQGGRYVFVNERGAPVTELGFRKTLARIAERVPALAGLSVHPHMLRHSCGYALANKGMDTRSLQHFLGHRRIENTEIYTAMSAARFDRVWD